jgi:hypothetical protein
MRCAIPRAAWVDGIGNFALIAWCDVPTVTLWKELAAAENQKAIIDRTGCGGRCSGRHQIVRVVLSA